MLKHFIYITIIVALVAVIEVMAWQGPAVGYKFQAGTDTAKQAQLAKAAIPETLK